MFPSLAAEPRLMVPLTAKVLTPIRHAALRALRVNVVYALAVDPDAAGKEPLVEALPPPPGMANPSWPLPLVTSWERELRSLVGVKVALCPHTSPFQRAVSVAADPVLVRVLQFNGEVLNPSFNRPAVMVSALFDAVQPKSAARSRA